jgi:diguanylate cyclase
VVGDLFRSMMQARSRTATFTVPPDLPDAPAGYYQRIESIARRIRATRDLSQIATILEEALTETRALHGEDMPADERIRRAEREIQSLKSDLNKAVELTNIDPLTELLNRRGMKTAFTAEAARSDRHGTPLCVAFIDIDDFKRINDSYGHVAGDAALKALARQMRSTLRPNDTLARFGGEEFVILLPDADERAAFAALNRLLKAVAGNVIVCGQHEVTFTFTASVTARALGETQDKIDERLDETLNRAKVSGKNRVMFATAG